MDNFSDHRYIAFNLDENVQNPSIPTKHHEGKLVTTFNRLIPRTPETYVEITADIEETVELITKALNNLTYSSCPKGKRRANNGHLGGPQR